MTTAKNGFPSEAEELEVEVEKRLVLPEWINSGIVGVTALIPILLIRWFFQGSMHQETIIAATTFLAVASIQHYWSGHFHRFCKEAVEKMEKEWAQKERQAQDWLSRQREMYGLRVDRMKRVLERVEQPDVKLARLNRLLDLDFAFRAVPHDEYMRLRAENEQLKRQLKSLRREREESTRAFRTEVARMATTHQQEIAMRLPEEADLPGLIANEKRRVADLLATMRTLAEETTQRGEEATAHALREQEIRLAQAHEATLRERDSIIQHLDETREAELQALRIELEGRENVDTQPLETLIRTIVPLLGQPSFASGNQIAKKIRSEVGQTVLAVWPEDAPVVHFIQGSFAPEELRRKQAAA